MVTDVELANYFRIIHLMFGGTGSILNLCLLYLAIFQTPKAIRLYSTLIINFAVTDALTCLLDIFIEIRFSLYLHTLSHSIWSLLISFGYRYLILFNTSFVKCSSVTLVILAFYLPSFLQAITYWTNFVERSEILPVIERVHPDYDFSENVGLLTGITDLSSVSVVYGMIHTTLPITPVYISVFVIRWKTVKILTKKRDFMSQDTKIMHSQLLKVLTLQAILPATTFGTSYLFIGLRLGIFSGQIYEHLVFSIAILMPVVSPMTYFVFVKPYRQFFIKKFCKKYYQPPIQDIARTRMYSNQEQTLTANRS